MNFPITSRYKNTETTIRYDSNDRGVVYLRRRFIPAVKQSALQVEHVVTQDERLDNISAQYLSNPELFWQLCDANNAMHPMELTDSIGLRLRIPVLEGF